MHHGCLCLQVSCKFKCCSHPQGYYFVNWQKCKTEVSHWWYSLGHWRTPTMLCSKCVLLSYWYQQEKWW
jgi:hypothetical protein